MLRKKLFQVLDLLEGFISVCSFYGLYTICFSIFFMYIAVVFARLNMFRQFIDFYAGHYLNSFELSFILRTYTIGLFRLLFKFKCMYKHKQLKSIGLYYAVVNWFEREIWDMFGIVFVNSLNHVRILTDYGFSGFPLRKDYPLVGYIECFYDYEADSIVYRNIFLLQEYRFFFKDIQ